MPTRHVLVLAVVALSCAAHSAAQDQLGTAFTYQGRLDVAGQPASGRFDFQFRLFDSDGEQRGVTLCQDHVLVTNGLISTTLDFGDQFGVAGLFLDIGVRTSVATGDCGVGAYTSLAPRQPLTVSPAAGYSLHAGDAFSAVNSSRLENLTSAFLRNADNLNAGTLLDDRLSGNVTLNDREQSFTDEKHFAARPTFDNPVIPFLVESSGHVPNLNADLLDGFDSAAFTQWITAGANIHNANAGNVGIGTATPQARLHIGGVPDNDGIMFPDGSLQVSASPWRVRPDKTFFLDGSVGIGTQDPTSLVHLKPTLDQTTMRIEADRYETAPDSVSDSSATATQIAGSDAAWANPGFAGTLNGVSATAAVTTPSGDDETNELELHNFGFNVPANATISSVRVVVTGAYSGSCTSCGGPYARLEFLKTARLVNGGTLGSIRTNRSTSISTSLGTSNELWGMTLTPAIVNSANFGVRLRVRMIPVTTYYDIPHPNGAPVDCPGCTASATVGVDGLQVTIFYGSPTLAHAEYTVGIGPNGGAFRISPSSDYSANGFALDQNGVIEMRNVPGNGTVLRVFGGAEKPGGGEWNATCDARLKRDIQPLEGALERLLTLRGYSFEFTDEALRLGLSPPGPQIGLIAQEVQEIFPDWVSCGKDGYLTVGPRGTTALMVEALRDLRAEKDRELAMRDAEIADLRQRLERLETAISGR